MLSTWYFIVMITMLTTSGPTNKMVVEGPYATKAICEMAHKDIHRAGHQVHDLTAVPGCFAVKGS